MIDPAGEEKAVRDQRAMRIVIFLPRKMPVIWEHLPALRGRASIQR
jgi:hypothetical protein